MTEPVLGVIKAAGPYAGSLAAITGGAYCANYVKLFVAPFDYYASLVSVAVMVIGAIDLAIIVFQNRFLTGKAKSVKKPNNKREKPE